MPSNFTRQHQEKTAIASVTITPGITEEKSWEIVKGKF
jgi:hypothetical protein